MGNSEFIHIFNLPESPSIKTILLLLHGTGGNETSMLHILDFIYPGAGVLSPRGKILENGLPRFFRRIREGVFDVEDLKHRTDELKHFIQDSAVKYHFTIENITAVGFSNGANIAASLLIKHPNFITHAILFHPMIPYVPNNLPDLSKTNVLITAGKNDPIVTVEESENLKKLFNQSNANVQFMWTNNGHNLTREELNQARKFIEDAI